MLPMPCRRPLWLPCPAAYFAPPHLRPPSRPQQEYQRLRDAAVDIIREMGVECGGSNVQVGALGAGCR